MKILLLMKRFSTNRDMIMENFGREVRLFSEINRLGHNVTVLCADQIKKERLTTKLNGMRVEIHPFSLTKLPKFLATARKMAEENEVVIGASHPLLGLIALLASAGRKKMVYDVRDNYEAYNFTNLPLLKRGMIPRLINNKIIRSCDLAVCAGELLKQKIASQRGNRPIAVVPNGVNTRFFRPLDRATCRKKLGLPPKAKIMVYTGHISEERGANMLIEAFKLVKQKYPEAVLLLSGKIDRGIDINQAGILYKELPQRKDVAIAINAADVAVVPNPENEATKYVIPYKLLEYMACGTSVVATAVGDEKELLKDHPEVLAQPGNPGDLALKITAAIGSGAGRRGKTGYAKLLAEYTWEKLARKLNTELIKLR